jgi:hypothetical protein
MQQPRRDRTSSNLYRHQGGHIYVEYLVVLGVVFIVVANTLAATGPSIVTSYQRQRSVLLSINP